MNVRRHAPAALFVLLLLAASAVAQETASTAADPAAPPAAGAARDNPLSATSDGLKMGAAQILALFRGLAGIPMWALVGCWFLTMSYTVERLVSLQLRRVAPKAFTTRFLQQLREHELDAERAGELIAVCRNHDTPVARFFRIVLENRNLTAFEIRTAVADAADAELYPLRRRIRAIGGLAALAPLLGLFGTVIGMIEAFQALAKQTGSSKTEMLASGISLALIATASGLAVAIMASISYYFLQGKVDQRVHELEVLTNEAVTLVTAPRRSQAPEQKPRRAVAEVAK